MYLIVAVALPFDLTWVKIKSVELISGIPVSEFISKGKVSPVGVIIVFSLNLFIFYFHFYSVVIIINLRNLQKSDIKIKIYIEKYDKYTFEVSNLLDSLLFLINYTDSKQGLSINTNKIDELNTGKLTDVAKGAQKSLTTTLIGKKKNDKFVVHPNCKKEIVSIEKLGKYLDLNNKSFNISCPICNKKYTLAEDNIKKIINVQNNKIQFNCKHIESEDYITQMPFSIDLKDYFESNTKEMKKIMFFVNNFKRLTLNAQ